MMKPETIKYIKELIEADVSCKQDRLLNDIRWDTKGYYQASVDSYKEAYHAQDDFEDWCDEQESE